jgi:hypothetical protein
MLRARVLALTAAAALFGLFPAAEGASAENTPAITHPTGTLLSVSPKAPVSVLATNIGGIDIGPSEGVIWYECSISTLTGSLENNTGSLFEATITSATFGGTAGSSGCTKPGGSFTITTDTGNGVPWCLRSTSLMADDEFQIRGNSCTGETRSLTVTIMGCTYEHTTPISGTFTTDTTGDAILKFANSRFVKEANQLLCVSPTFLSGSYTLERDTTSSADPLYIS